MSRTDLLIADPRNPRAVALRDALEARLEGTELAPNLRVPIGGDGWMLRCVHDQSRDGDGLVWLGLNAGHVGFLLNDLGEGGVDRVAELIAAGRYHVHGFPRLRGRAGGEGGAESLAINDVYLERSSDRTVQLKLTIDGVPVVERLVCDGLIVSTALGSTAYSFSAGGRPLHPTLRAVQVTPICPHTPRLSSFTLPERCTIEIEVLDAELRPASAVADGVDQGPVTRMVIEPARSDVRLAFLEGHDFTATLVSKILRA